MSTKLIAEIGLNHFGKFNYLKNYLKILKGKDIQGISIQIINKKKVSKNLKRYYLNKQKIKQFFFLAKKYFKNVGVAIHSWDDFDFLKKLQLNFIKILGSSFGDKNYLVNVKKTKVKKIFLSTLNKTDSEINKFLTKIKKNKITLIHTFINTPNFEKEIKKISKYKKKYKLRIAYGNHYKKINSINKVCKYNPSEIFFYVKFDIKKKYPDDKHAIPLNKLNNLIRKIRYDDKIQF